MIKTWACLDENNTVIAIADLDLYPGQDAYDGAVAYIQYGVEFGSPEVGQVWDGQTLKFN